MLEVAIFFVIMVLVGHVLAGYLPPENRNE